MNGLIPAIPAVLLFGALACSQDDGLRSDALPGDFALQGDRALAATESGSEAGSGSSTVNFVVQGCQESTEKACKGQVPLRLTFSAVLAVGKPTVSWDFGDKSGSEHGLLANHSYSEPGTYDVTLSVAEPGGTVSEVKQSFIWALPAEPGAACASDSACASGSCVCGGGPGAAAKCPFPLDRGLCLQACQSAPCPIRSSGGPGFVCVKLSLGAGASAKLPWQADLCLPGCQKGGSCARQGFVCELAPVGSGWAWACVPPGLGAVGKPCRTPAGAVDATRCVGGKCLDIGAGGYCSAACVAGSCPEGTRCASFSSDPLNPVCLVHCQGVATCSGDPFLFCEEPYLKGPLGFEILGAAPAKGSKFCAPKRCKLDGACGLTGSCKPAGDGFCTLQ